jgi:hypothetical protein
MRANGLFSAAVWLFAVIGLVSGSAVAADSVGQITHLSGLLSVKRADGSSRVFSVKSEVQEGDTLSTEQETYARVKFKDGAEIVLRPGTQMTVASYVYDEAKPAADNVLISMFKGGFRAVTGLLGKRNHDSVKFTTASATIGIRGTHFGALLCQADCGGVNTASGSAPPDGLHIDVADGAIVVSNGGGQQLLNAGQFGFVRDSNTPPAEVPPQAGVQVTMPSSISQNTAGGRGVAKGNQEFCAGT